jgi:hypothetical protein
LNRAFCALRFKGANKAVPVFKDVHMIPTFHNLVGNSPYIKTHAKTGLVAHFPCTRESLSLCSHKKQDKIALSWCRLTVVQGASLTLCRTDMLVTYPSAMTLLFFREIPVGVYINSAGGKSQEKIALF